MSLRCFQASLVLFIFLLSLAFDINLPLTSQLKSLSSFFLILFHVTCINPAVPISRDPHRLVPLYFPGLWSYEVHDFLSSGKPHHCLQLFHPLWNLYIIYSSFKMLSNTVLPLDTFLRLHEWNWKMFLPKPEPGTAHSFQFKCWF